MKKLLWTMALSTLPLMSNAALVGFNAEDGSSYTAPATATVGSEWTSTLSDAEALGGKFIETSTPPP